MSTYRGYVPWKSTLSSYSPAKAGDSGSRYSSREEVADTKTAPRFGSISSPSSYRPSYSGGTYRSAGIKRDPAATTNYTGKYTSLSAGKEDKEKVAAPLKKPSSITPKYGSSKDVSTTEPKSTPTSRYSSTGSLTSTNRLKPKETLSERRSTMGVNKVKSREASPTTKRTYGGRSRDPSPSEPAKERFGPTSNPYMSNLNRFYPRSTASSFSYSSGYGGNSSSIGSRSNSSALSYMNANEASVRNTRRRLAKEDTSSSNSSSVTKEKSKEKEQTPTDIEIETKNNEPEVMVDVSVITRGTSPSVNPATNISRMRRIEVAKTVEKIIQRPLRRPRMEDKMIQSDRLDDSTKYCRFLAGNNSNSQSWSNYVESKFSRASKSSSSSPSNKSETIPTSNGTEKTSSSVKSRGHSVSKSASSSRTTNTTASNGHVDKSKTKSPSPAAGHKHQSPSKYRTNSARALPPPVPKESPTKTIPSSSSSTSNASNSSKWANKDFRKSALNVGPTDRPRKTRASSVGSEDSSRDSNRSQKSASPCHRTDRSSSVSSEISSSSTTTTSNAEDVSKSFGKMRISPSPAPILHDDMHSENNDANCAPMPISVTHATIKERQSTISPLQTTNGDSNLCSMHSVGPITHLMRLKSPNSVDECELHQLPDNNSMPVSVVSDNGTHYTHDRQFDANVSTRTTSSTNLRANDTDNTSCWLNSIPYDPTTPATVDQSPTFNGSSMKYKLRHIDSGELPWWMTNDDDITMAEDITLNQSETEGDASIVEDQNNGGSNWLGHSDNSWKLSNESATNANHSMDINATDPNRSTYKISHIRSGERAWWMDDNNNVNGHVKSEPVNFQSKLPSDTVPNNYSVQSEEQPTWMSNSDSHLKYPIKYVNMQDDIDQPWWMQTDGTTGANASTNTNQVCEEIQDAIDKVNLDFTGLPLGDRSSPEGLEDINSKNRLSASYNFSSENIEKVQKNVKKVFISRYENVDDLLGGSCHTLNPMLLDRFSGDVFEEITPAQVRIHDSTAQMPFIHRMTEDDRDPWDSVGVSSPALDDATLQVFKDGDYGAYLDLESSLAEQSEEIEGLHSGNRKTSLVVRTQLSVRVHAIIEKLLTSEGRELRRSLFSLKQIFQDDKDLVHGFVALGGLNSLVRVGNGADQNYQNYILRALGQVMLYVDGMNGVMKHQPTIQWLYSLIASKYRLVVKTALKLLLVFVEYVESNCYLLVNAIHAVDGARDCLPWTNAMRLLKDYENADTELLIYATSLINKTLSGLSDQDSYYDESDYLEQQGMEGVVQRYMSRPGTDLDLLDQLQLYETVLKFEDGENDGICIPENTVRKTLRCRSINMNGTEAVERRKSRRHSTENTLHTSPVTKLYSPMHQTLDEDSSSSANSGELNEVFGMTKGIHEGAGVTPGLRRRRERAERQKSFLREQQEAVTAGKNSFELKDDNHDTIVTAVPFCPQNDNHSTLVNILVCNRVNPLFCNEQSLSGSTSHSSDRESTCSSDVVDELDIMSHNYNYDALPNCDVPIKETVINSLINKTNSNNGLHNDLNETDNHSYRLFEQKSNRLNQFYNQLNSINGYGHTNAMAISNQKTILTKNNNSYGSSNNNVANNDMICAKLDALMSPPSNGLNSVTDLNSYNQNGLPSSPPPLPSKGIISPKATAMNGNSRKSYIITNGNAALLPNGQGMDSGVSAEKRKESESGDKKMLLQLKRDHTVKDLTQKLSNLPMSPQEEKIQSRIGDMTGLISKAKEGLAKSKSKGEISRSPSKDQEIKKTEPKKSENELHWEDIKKNMVRQLTLCDLDFTDLLPGDDMNDVIPGVGNGKVPPPPPMRGPPPMLKSMPPPTNLIPPPYYNDKQNGQKSGDVNGNGGLNTIQKSKKTVKLFWKEVREDLIPVTIGKTIWDELPNANIDTQKLEHLFESRAKDLMTKKQQDLNKNKEIIVLDHKRSNAINIAMKKLPPPRAIKAAILKMDATVVTREGIEKVLNMLPTEEERGKIQEAQMLNLELPLGSAEQFLLTLSSISELSARLKLWAFKLDFENNEKEIAEPLMDLKQGVEVLKNNKTFKCILSTLLSIGIFLNGAPVKGFQIEYLAKVPEVKDTVHKHSLLHHLCHMVMETATETTDLYSEIGPVTRASKADFADLAHNIAYLETECKASWDRLKLIAKHDCPAQLKQKLIDFLADCAERIIILDIVHRRVLNRYKKFLLWLGVPQHRIAESRPNEICRIISEFALEYRTTRERVLQQVEKKANHRERNKTRGKMITDVGKFKTKEDRADAELKQLLGSKSPLNDTVDSGLTTWRRRRPDALRSPGIKLSEEHFTDGDDEILESLVKTVTKASGAHVAQRERKRTRHADRKSLRRTLKNGLSEEEKQQVAAFAGKY